LGEGKKRENDKIFYQRPERGRGGRGKRPPGREKKLPPALGARGKGKKGVGKKNCSKPGKGKKGPGGSRHAVGGEEGNGGRKGKGGEVLTPTGGEKEKEIPCRGRRIQVEKGKKIPCLMASITKEKGKKGLQPGASGPGKKAKGKKEKGRQSGGEPKKKKNLG